jgi:hypothetical protein
LRPWIYEIGFERAKIDFARLHDCRGECSIDRREQNVLKGAVLVVSLSSTGDGPGRVKPAQQSTVSLAR